MNIADIYKTDLVFGTEGEIKSEISAKRLNQLFLGIPGVGNYSEAVSLLKQWKTKKFVLCYDADTLKSDNNQKLDNLMNHIVKFASQLLKEGIDCYLWTWNISDAKGIDDLILKNKTKLLQIHLTSGKKEVVDITKPVF